VNSSSAKKKKKTHQGCDERKNETHHAQALDKESRVLVYTRRRVHGLLPITIRMAISIRYVFRGRNNVGMGEHNPDGVKGYGEEMVREEGRRWYDAKTDNVSEYKS